jgi:ribose transport system permease protein
LTNTLKKIDSADKIKNILLESMLIIGFIFLLIFFSIVNPAFWSFQNINSILLRVAIASSIAYGIMLSLIGVGIDLSPGASVGLAGLGMVLCIEAGLPTGVGIIVGLLVGLAVGAVNGILISRASMNPFIVTLSIMFIGNSIERVITRGGLPIYLYGPSATKTFEFLFRGKLLGIQFPIWVMLFVTIIYYIFLERSIFGRRLYSCGMSLKGAKASGINVRRYYFLIYTISGISAAVAGLLVASQVRSGQPMVGKSFLWDAIGAAYLSTLMSKNMRPNILGTLFGVIVLAVLTNGLTLLGLNFYWKEFFRGFLIIIILLISVVKRKIGEQGL